MEVFLVIILISLIFINFFRKSEIKVLIIIFNVMNSLGIISYSLGINYYKIPKIESRIILEILLIIFNIAYIFYTISPRVILANKNRKIEKNSFNIIYFWMFTGPLILYFLYFYEHFSIYYMVKGIAIKESIRPDVSGTLPKYYTFSVLLTCFTLPYLVGELKRSRKWKKLGIGLLILFLCILIGNKSTILTIVFFNLFIEKKIKIKEVIKFLILFLIVYVGMKVLYYREFRFNGIFGIFESIFRRVVMINTSLIGEYIQYFILDDLEIPENFNHIKQFLFYRIYHTMQGGASCNFIASLLGIFKFGYIQSILYFFIFYITFYLLEIFKKITLFNGALNTGKNYLFFYGLVLLANGFISDYFIRIIIPVFVFYIFSKAEYTFYNKKSLLYKYIKIK